MNRKQLIQAIIFILIFGIGIMCVSYILRTNGDVKDRFSGFYAEKNDTLDIVMIGSSPIPTFYSAPKIWGETGITMYPLASNVQRPVAATYLIDEALKSQNPSLFVFEMRMYTMTDDHISENISYTRGVTDNLKYSANRIKTIKGMVPESEDMLSFYFDIFKYHTNWRMLFLPSEWTNAFYHKKSPLKGFLMHNEVGPTDMPECTEEEGRREIPSEQEVCLRNLLSYLEENNLEALFITSPYGETIECQEMSNYIGDIVEEAGYPYLDMNLHYDEIGLDFAEDFADYGSHTNAVGAEKVTSFFEQYLLDNYEFTDKRNSRGYESWDEAYELWLTEYSEAEATIMQNIANGNYAER